MREAWQVRLARFAKRHPVFRSPVFAFLWLGCQFTDLATAWSNRWQVAQAKKADDAQHSQPKRVAPAFRLRVLALSLAAFMVLSQLSMVAYGAAAEPAEQAEPQPAASDVPPADDSQGGQPGEEEGDDTSQPTGGDESDTPTGGTDDDTSDTSSSEADDSDTSTGEDDSDTSSQSSPSDTGEPGGDEEEEPEQAIIGFLPLDPAIALQHRPVGTPLEELVLPASLTAVLNGPSAGEAEGENPAATTTPPQAEGEAEGELLPEAQAASLAPAGEAEPATEPESVTEPKAEQPPQEPAPPPQGEQVELPVLWQAEPEYNEEMIQSYTFTPVLPQQPPVAEGVALPAITVVLEEAVMTAAADVQVFVGGPLGNDATGDGSRTKPFATISTALDEVSGANLILLLGDVLETNNIGALDNRGFTIKTDGSLPTAVITRGATNGDFINIEAGTLTLENVILDGAGLSPTSNQSPLVSVGSDATLNLNSATLRNNKNNVTSGTTGQGGAILSTGTVNVNAGTSITGNEAAEGGGIAVTTGGTLNMNGGSIAGNGTLSGTRGVDLYVAGYAGMPFIETHVVFTGGTVGSQGNGGYFLDVANGGNPANVTIASTAFTVYVEHATGVDIASTAGYSGNTHVAATRFIKYDDASGLSVGMVIEGYIQLSPPSPIILHYVPETDDDYVPDFKDTLQLALNAVDSSKPVAYISLRQDLEVSAAPSLPSGLAAAKTVLRSENLTGAGTVRALTYTGSAPFFTLESKTLSAQTLDIATTGATNPFVVDGGTFMLETGAQLVSTGTVLVESGTFSLASGTTLTAAGDGVDLQGGSFTQAGALSVLTPGGRAVVASGGSYQLTGATSGGAGVLLAGGNMTMGTGATITGTVNGVTLSDEDSTLTMSGGSISANSSNGVVVNDGTLLLQGGRVEENEGGAGVYMAGGEAVVTSGSVITGNGVESDTASREDRAGVYVGSGASFTLTNGTISANNGNGVYLNGGTFTMNGTSAVVSDHAGGSGVYADDGTLALNGGQVTRNEAADGAGVYVAAGLDDFAMALGMTVTGNTASGNGGGLYLEGARTIAGGVITANEADGNGGGIYKAGAGLLTVGGSATIGLENYYNTAINGGGIYVEAGGAALAGGVRYNRATGSGGGVYVEAGGLTLSSATLANNTAADDGGGAYVLAGDISLNKATLAGNTATDGRGGGLSSAAVGNAVNIEESVIGGDEDTGNTAGDGGGGLHINGGTTTISGGATTISFNVGTRMGGGISTGGGTLQAGNAIFASNVSMRGGGLYTMGDTTLNTGTYFAGNTAGSGNGAAIYLNGADLTLNGGEVGTGQRANGVGREAGENILLDDTNFDPATTVVVLEHTSSPYTPYERGDPIYNSDDGDYPDWLTVATVNGKDVGGAFWAIDAEDGLLRGVHTGGKIEFQPASIRVEFIASGEPATVYTGTLQEAFDLIVTRSGSGRVTANVVVGENVTVEDTVAVGGNAAITLKSDAPPESPNTKFVIDRTGSFDLFELAGASTTLRLAGITLDGDDAGGSLVKVEAGRLELSSAAVLQNNADGAQHGTAVAAEAGTVVVEGPTVQDVAGLSTYAISGSANLLLKTGKLDAVYREAPATITIDEDDFDPDPAKTGVVMVGDYEEEAEIGFVICPDGLKEAAAPLFSAKTSGGKDLVGGVRENKLYWLAIKVMLTVDSGDAVGYTSLPLAFADIPTTSGTTATVTLLEGQATTPVVVPAGVSVAINTKNGGLMSLDRGAGGDLITVQGSLALAARLTVDGKKANYPAAGTLVKLEGGSLALSGILQNNSTTGSGGAVNSAGGAMTMGSDARITGNAAAGSGGGIYQSGTASLAMAGGTITGNTGGGSLTAEGSGVYIAGGGLTLSRTPVIGQSIFDNTLYTEGGPIILGSGYGAGARIHVRDDDAQIVVDVVAQKGAAVDPAEAGTFRHVSAEGKGDFVGAVSTTSDTQVVWGEPQEYALHSWEAGGRQFSCTGDYDKFLYLMVDGKLVPTDQYEITENDDGTSRFVIKSSWPGPEDTARGYYVEAAYTDGYGRGSANSIELVVGSTKSYYATLELALKAAPENAASTIRLYGTAAITGETDNGVLVVGGQRRVTLESEDPGHTVLRATGGALVTVQNGSTLTIKSTTLDGLGVTPAGSLAVVEAGGSLTLDEGAVLKNNTATTHGGGVQAAGSLTIEDGAITGNTSAQNGGGIYLSGGALSLGEGSTVTGNTAVNGGGVYAGSGTFALAGGEVTANTASGEGSGVLLSSKAPLTVTSGILAGVALYDPEDPGDLPDPATITLVRGFDADNTAIALEGVASGAGLATVPTGQLVALFGANHGMGTAEKKIAAGCISHSFAPDIELRGLLDGTGAGVVLADASSVALKVGDDPEEKYASIDQAMLYVPGGATAIITLLKDVTMTETVAVNDDRTITLTARGGSFTALRGAGVTGDLFTVAAGSALTLDGSGGGTLTVDGNKTQFTGGAGGSLVAMAGGSLAIGAGATLQNNRTATDGGAVRATGGTLTVAGGTFAGGEARHGGAIYTTAALAFTGGTFEENGATGNGGALWYSLAAGDLALAGGALGTAGKGNTATGSGGGAYVAAAKTVLMEGATFTGNTAGQKGGGLYIATGAAALSGGSFGGNTAAQGGGGAFLASGVTLVVTGGQLGTGTETNGLVQQPSSATAPAVTVAGALAATHYLNLEGRAGTGGAVGPHADNDLVALLDDGITYEDQLTSARRVFYTGTGGTLYATLNPTATGILLRQYIQYTEPLYTEKAETALGGNVNWQVRTAAGAISEVKVKVRNQWVTLDGTPGTGDYSLVPGSGVTTLQLAKAYLDTLENGTYEAAITTATAGEISTGFTVEGQYTAILRVGGQETYYRSLAAAIADAPANRAATISLLTNIELAPTQAIDGNRQITITSESGTNTITRKGTGDLFRVDGGANLTFANITVDGDKASYASGAGGALVQVAGGKLILDTGASLENNRNQSGGGAVVVASGSFEMKDGTITGNEGTVGGGVAAAGGSATLAGGAISGNTATTGGGGLGVSGGTVALIGTEVSGNKAPTGGGIGMTGGKLTASGGEVAGNEATTGTGGGINLADGAEFVSQTGFELYGNLANGAGKGVYLDENASFTQRGGSIGAVSDTPPLDNGLAFSVNNPPKADGAFSGLQGNLNLEGMYDGAAGVDFGDDTIPVMLPPGTKPDYHVLVEMANAIRYEDSGAVYHAVAVPDAAGNFSVTTVEDLFQCFTLYRQVESDDLVYWRFAHLRSPAEVVEVHVEGEWLDPVNYTKETGSIFIQLKKEYLKTLAPGVYSLQVYLTPDDPAAGIPTYAFRFVVQLPPKKPGQNPGQGTGAEGYDGVYDTTGKKSPQTGDRRTPGPWKLVSLASLLGLLGSLVMLWKRKKSGEESKKTPAAED